MSDTLLFPVTDDARFPPPDPPDVAFADPISVSVGPSGNPAIDGVLIGIKWNTDVVGGVGVTPLTFSFPDSPDDYEPDYETVSELADFDQDFAQVSPAQMEATRALLTGTSASGTVLHTTAVAQFADFRFTDAGSGTADIRVGQHDQPGTAFAYYPGNHPIGGDVWFGTTFDYRNPVLGTYAYQTHAHELGHALGLKHGHEAGGPGDRSVPAELDSLEFTTMTYRSFVGGPTDGYTNEFWGFPQSFMMLDIAALQYLYGANYGHKSSNTLYQWNPTTGETIIDGAGQGTPGGGVGGEANRVFLTIWDGGGHDTYDFSNYANDVLIDLTPGRWSVTSPVQLANLGLGHFARGNVFNALQHPDRPGASLIEDAIGGSGNDNIRGNAAGNYLAGRAGDDLIAASAGFDFYDGGDGFDRVVFDVAMGDAAITRFGGVDWTVGAAQGFAILHGVELALFTDGFLQLV